MSTSDLAQTIEHSHRALDAIVRGDPDPQKRLFSRCDDVTLANPLGPPARRWSQVETALERAVAQLREGEPVRFEHISEFASPELAYILEIEVTRVKVSRADDLAPVSLRVTTIFRREEDGWKIAHRHADPITASRYIESIIER